MFGLRSLRNRLAVVFGLIVLGAIGTIYLTVTPRLEERLRNQKLDGLAMDARRAVGGDLGLAARYNTNPNADSPLQEQRVTAVAAAASAEVLIFDKLKDPVALSPQIDS